MQIDRSELVALLHSHGDHGIAAQAGLSLPLLVDTDHDRGLLDRYGIDVEDPSLASSWVDADPPRR